jgi:hypothetical protein
MRIWHPNRWRNFDRTIRRVVAGDVICNPVYVNDNDESRDLATRIGRELAARGLRIDHPSATVGWVEEIAE